MTRRTPGSRPGRHSSVRSSAGFSISGGLVFMAARRFRRPRLLGRTSLTRPPALGHRISPSTPCKTPRQYRTAARWLKILQFQSIWGFSLPTTQRRPQRSRSTVPGLSTQLFVEIHRVSRPNGDDAAGAPAKSASIRTNRGSTSRTTSKGAPAQPRVLAPDVRGTAVPQYLYLPGGEVVGMPVEDPAEPAAGKWASPPDLAGGDTTHRRARMIRDRQTRGRERSRTGSISALPRGGGDHHRGF